MAKPKNKKPASKPSAARATSDGAKPERVEVAAAARQPTLSSAQSSAFRKRFSEAECESRGTRTKARAVLVDVRAWIPQIERGLGEAGTTIRYSPARFAWLLFNVANLSAATEGDVTVGAGVTLAIATSRAREVRKDLSAALGAIAAGDETDTAGLSAARGETQSSKQVLDSLRAIVKQAKAWLAETDEESVALVESIHLTQADVDAGQASADALASALEAKIVTGREAQTDEPATNRIEGRVTYEMAVAKAAFDAAAARGIGQRLVPGPGTRALFSTPKPGKAAKASGASAASDASAATK